MIHLTRRVEFSAAHTLHNPELDTGENTELFGKCGKPEGHGHNYVLEVTVRGEVDGKTGFFINVHTLKEIIDREIIDVLDHTFINREIDYFQTHVPTCENIAMWIWKQLVPALSGCELYRVRLYETRNNYVEYFGDEIEQISEIDPLRGNVLRKMRRAEIYPGSHYATTQDTLKRAIKAIQHELRTFLDIQSQDNVKARLRVGKLEQKKIPASNPKIQSQLALYDFFKTAHLEHIRHRFIPVSDIGQSDSPRTSCQKS